MKSIILTKYDIDEGTALKVLYTYYLQNKIMTKRVMTIS